MEEEKKAFRCDLIPFRKDNRSCKKQCPSCETLGRLEVKKLLTKFNNSLHK